MTNLFPLVADLDKGAFGAGLDDVQVSLGARRDAVVLLAALLALLQQRALARGAQRRSAARRRHARVHRPAAHVAGRGARLATRGLRGQVQPVTTYQFTFNQFGTIM